jgi:hypothetical protein
VGTDLDTIDAMHIEDGNPDLVRDDDLMLQFKCECSDEECEVRIPLRLSLYRQIHLDRNTFIVRPDHQVESIERVLCEEQDYSVVKKRRSTPEPNDELKKTDIRNKK